MADNKKKRELPITGILIAVVVVLAVCVAVLGWLVMTKEKSGSSGEGQRQTVETGTIEKKAAAGKPEAEREAEAVDGQREMESGSETVDSQRGLESGSETVDSQREMKSESKATGSQSETKSESKSTDEPETERKSKATDESEVESESEAAGESETERELETESESETEIGEKLVVAIDPGHQGSWVNMSDTEPNGPGSSEMKAKASTGTQGSFSGKPEYELNLEISLLLRDELEKRGYEVILTREDNDTAISNAERAQMAYEQGGNIYVRIHANGSDNSGVSGALAMVPSSSNPYVGYLAEDSYLLADCILNAYCSKASFQSLGIQYYDNMTGINWSQLPVMILEMGFMTNQSDDLRMADASVQPLMAEGIADGIDRYFTEKGMKKKAVSPEAKAKMDALLERLGEDYVYPAVEQGEKWAVTVKDLDTGAQGSLGGDQPMKSASIIKVFIMAAIYDRVCYPSSEERHISFPESYDGELKQLITDMITVSDNDAANTLIERLGNGDVQAGMAVVNQFCEENGYTATSLGRRFLEQNPSGDNFTSAEDCCRLLESIYTGTCVCPEASAKMYEYLKNQTRKNKIPVGLSGTTATASNKTGELAGDYGDYVENDIAVVEDGDSAYVLCVMSGELKDNGSAIERIASISRAVYEQR